MMELEEARCLLCFHPLTAGDNFIVVRLANPEDGRLVTPENRSGAIHLRHLQNVFTPSMIQVVDSQMGLPVSPALQVRVNL